MSLIRAIKRLMPYSLAALLVLASVAAARADIIITLTKPFIEEFRHRVSISADFTVDKAHKRPNPGSKDGDLHVAGRAPQIGLPIVAEIMNAAERSDVVDLIHMAEQSKNPVAMSGVWRIWCEHGGDSQQEQFSPLSPFTTTNPDHVFEVHPVLSVGSRSSRLDLLDTLHPIKGFKPKDAEAAFAKYEDIRSRITVGADTISVRTTMAGFNYVKFGFRPDFDTLATVEDGAFVSGDFLDVDGEKLASNRYAVFPKGSAAHKKLRSVNDGEYMVLLGIPRVSLARVWWRAEHPNDSRDVLNWNLPYEIVIVGFYGITKE